MAAHLWTGALPVLEDTAQLDLAAAVHFDFVGFGFNVGGRS